MAVEYRYLDILWVDNLLMNFIILWITSKIIKSQGPIWRLWLAAFLGATYAAVLFIPKFQILSRLTMKIALSLTMLLVAYEFNSLKEYIKILGAFYAVTFVFGGAALGLYYFSEDTIDISGGIFYLKNYPIKILFISTTLVIIIFRGLWIIIKNRQIRSKLLYKVAIEFDKKSILVMALLDTGNALCDPISQAPVIVVEYQQIKSILPLEVRMVFTSEQENDLAFVTKMIASCSWVERFRMIPYTALGKNNGMLIGFRPDRVLVFMDEKWRVINNTIIGIYNQRLSKDEQYHALIHPEIIA